MTATIPQLQQTLARFDLQYVLPADEADPDQYYFYS